MRPPRFWRAILRCALWADRRRDIDADLTEELAVRAAQQSPAAARRWYRQQTLGFVAARLRGSSLPLPGRGLGRVLTIADVRVALRQARRQPVATITTIGALAAVIGLSVIGFTLGQGFFFVSSTFPSGDLVHAAVVHRNVAGATSNVYPEEVVAWAQGARSIQAIGAAQIIFPAIESGELPPLPLESARVTPSPFARISPPPHLGRHLVDDDALPGAERVVVISYFVWNRLFGADPDIISKVVSFGGKPHTIVGVMPRGWLFPAAQEAWLPLSLETTADAATARVAGGATERRDEYSGTWLVLADGASPETASEELTAIARQLSVANAGSEITVEVMPYADFITPAVFKTVAALILGLLLIFLCGVSLNVATLVLARCAMRTEELAIRSAMGAQRMRIVAQLFMESLIPSLLAAGLATFGLRWAMAWIDGRIDGALPMFINLKVSPIVFAYAVLLAMIASGLAGAVPALRVTRTDASARLLSAGGTRSTPASLGRLASVMLELQLVAALTLLGLAGLAANAFATYTDVAVGPVNEEQILTAMLFRDPRIAEQTGATGSDAELLYRLRDEWVEALATIPGAEAVAVTEYLPKQSRGEERVEVDDVGDPQSARRVRSTRVGPGLFRSLGVAPTLGRTITPVDATPDAVPVVVVSESFVADVLGGSVPLGRRLRAVDETGEAGPWAEIIGVVPDLAPPTRGDAARGEIYRPLIAANPVYATVLFGDGDVRGMATGLRNAIQEMDPTVRVTDAMAYSRAGWEVRTGFAIVGSALAGLGGVAMLLSLAGVYSLASLAVSTRTREIGTRVALGAPPRAVLRTILGRTTRQLGLGLAAAIALAALAARLTMILPFEVPVSFGLVVPALALILLAGGLVASWIPARRALRIEPMAALRSE